METTEELSARTLSRVSRRLMPFLFALYVFAYLDRVNVGYAALFIRRELSFSDTVYGTGAGLFFLSYALFEVPSNLILLRVGPRRWIGLLMAIWGVISASMPLVHTPFQFYLLRFLLGAAEAGFFPGIVLYLTYWFPKQQRARAVARFMAATAIAGVIGAPLSNLLFRLDGVAGIAGWKWLFVGEGVPSILLGTLVFWVLTDTPHEASWLSADERNWLIETLTSEQANIPDKHSMHLRDVWRNSMLWRLAFIYFAISVGLYSLSLWLPVVLKQISHASDARVILLTAVPYLAATIAMLWIAHSSDKRQKRRWYLVASLIAAMLGFILSAWLANPWLAMASLSLATAGIWGGFGPFWSMPTSMLRGTAAAGGIAIINSVGGLGGFCGPYLMGAVSDATHNFHAALLTAAGLLLLAALVAARLRAI
ncbi:MFS transporter [Acidobacterium sp. S8]|uniref:MFS transporter n=1 Tax=Acidobacterium sp. S8 TaxID=1641854 RepID=UPI00131DFCE4|nr:MFS transporter [Acidobacterium sp. S8]